MKRNVDVNQNYSYTRNPMYVFYALGSWGLFILAYMFSRGPNVGILEQTIFEVFYRIPDQFSLIFRFILFIGSFGLLAIYSILYVLRRRYDIVVRIVAACTFAYMMSHYLAIWIGRSYPGDLLSNVDPRVNSAGYAFPAIYVAIATSLGLTISLYTARNNRKWITYNILAVAASVMFLGIGMPLDIISGYAVGLFCFSIASLLFGSIYNPIDIKKLTKILKEGGMKQLVLKSAKVDARGSVPFFGSYENGPVFVKVFNQDNNAADWLFKIFRRIMYRRLEDEVPSLTPKRTIEHEAYITMLAKSSAGARVPQVIGVFKVAHNSYAMATDLIVSDGLDSLSESQISDKMLLDVWHQINILHNGRIIHKDLRTANIMIEKETNLPWIIDFGFSESAVDKKSFYKDNVEFIASSASIVGPHRAVKVATKALGKQAIRDALPYMQFAALSGATTTSLKKQGILDEIRSEMLRASKLTAADNIKAKISRLSRRRNNKR